MMTEKPDISTKDDVKVFVNAFYDQVKIDTTIGPVFAAVIGDGPWDVHLERMYSFWNTVLFGVKDYQGNPFSKHADLPIQAPHFAQWISLLSETVDHYYAGPKAEEVKKRARSMGAVFESKLTHLRQNPQYKNIM